MIACRLHLMRFVLASQDTRCTRPMAMHQALAMPYVKCSLSSPFKRAFIGGMLFCRAGRALAGNVSVSCQLSIWLSLMQLPTLPHSRSSAMVRSAALNHGAACSITILLAGSCLVAHERPAGLASTSSLLCLLGLDGQNPVTCDGCLRAACCADQASFIWCWEIRLGASSA